MRLRRVLAACLAVLASAALALATLGSGSAAAGGPSGGTTAYAPGTVSVDGIAGGPWNTSQGDPSEGNAYSTADLFPTYTPGGATTTAGGVVEPNLAVYPSASGATPYPSGVAGTPGPLDGYCSSGGPNPETGTPVSQPAGTLPFAPYYFPDVVRNADGSLTGYFDYRPKDADEAITVARSTDNGLTWTNEGEALDQNQGYCPTADTNDDGQGHPYVMAVNSDSNLYTLQRPAGDNTGIGLLVHPVDPSASDPLAKVPPRQSVGIDPNTFATASAVVPASGSDSSTSIAVSTLGSAGSPEQIVAGPYEDLSAPTPSQSIITCTGTTSGPPLALTGCTVSGSASLSVVSGDDLVQVFATADPGTGETFEIPQGPNSPDGSGGLATLNISSTTSVSPITTYILNVNAPNRVYIDGATVYCVQSNANPTTKIENCTTTTPGGITVNQGDAITSDPIIPANTQMTSGLIAPDGIVGTLPGSSYPGAAPGSTVVLYTEKILSYFISGTINGYVASGKFTAATGGSKNTLSLPMATINYTPSVTTSEQPPSSGTFTVYLGTTTAAGGGSTNPIQAVTCTGSTAATQTGAPSGSVNLTGCTGGSGFVALGNWLGAPGAAIAPFSVLNQTGEGKNGTSSGPEKLFGNNEDLTILRAADTTDGVNFTDLGPISGTDPDPGADSDTGAYDDVSNPDQQYSPDSSSDPGTATLNPTAATNLAPGSPDSVELRYIGSRGTIVTNPDGSLGMFLSGAWATDGDSDAFNQIFYTSSTDGGQQWSVPKVVLSTDYTFAASAAQDANPTQPLGISAYYSGRAYGPSVVQNPNGTLTMVFSGYRLPKPITNAGTVLGTNSSSPYTVGATDPALYRNILTMTLQSSTSPGVQTMSTLGSTGPQVVYGTSVTYTDTVSVPAPGSGTPTGTVDFFDDGAQITDCQNVALSQASPDTAQCTTVPDAGSRSITAVYSGDSNYAGSTGNFTEQVSPAALTVTAGSLNRLFGQPNPPLTYTIKGFVNGDSTQSAVTGSASCSTSATQTSVAGPYPITCTTGTLAAANYSFTTFVPGTLTVGYSRVVSGLLVGLPVTIPSGQSWELARGATVLGELVVGAGSSVDIEPGAIVLGEIVTNGADTVRVCGATLLASLSASGDSGPILIGNGTSSCPASSIAGPITLRGDTGGVTIERAQTLGALSVSGSSGGVTITGSFITGGLSVTDNAGGVTVDSNTVTGPLTVTGNSGTVVDRPNTVLGPSHIQ